MTLRRRLASPSGLALALALPGPAAVALPGIVVYALTVWGFLKCRWCWRRCRG